MGVMEDYPIKISKYVSIRYDPPTQIAIKLQSQENPVLIDYSHLLRILEVVANIKGKKSLEKELRHELERGNNKNYPKNQCVKCESKNITPTKYGFSVCRDCGYQWVVDPLLWRESYTELSSCPDCWGTGEIYDRVNCTPSKCSSCDGTGWLGIGDQEDG
jgi:hypothetical protein